MGRERERGDRGGKGRGGAGFGDNLIPLPASPPMQSGPEGERGGARAGNQVKTLRRDGGKG